VLFVLSLGDVYAFIAESGVPFATVIRVSSRLIAIPLVLFLMVATQGLDLLLKDKASIWRPVVVAGIAFVGFELITHSQYWNIAYLEELHPPVHQPNLSLMGNPPRGYRLVVYVSWAVSWATLFLVASRLWFPTGIRLRKRPPR
jgi:hypothetical protein